MKAVLATRHRSGSRLVTSTLYIRDATNVIPNGVFGVRNLNGSRNK
jgi:hypothetical protein